MSPSTHFSELYADGSYLEKNPSWHVEDSQWKATQILKMLARNNLHPSSICEVGCGAGEILRQLHDRLDFDPKLTGYEISPQAYGMALERSSERLDFLLKDIFEDGTAIFDLALVIDVIEHVEDYHSFLRRLRSHAPHMIFHIPLEISANSALRPETMVQSRIRLGHLHYFTESTALDVLRVAGYEIIDWFYTASYTTFPHTSSRQHILDMVRRILFPRFPKATVRICGGYSLLALATPAS